MARSKGTDHGAGIGTLLQRVLTDAVVQARAGILPHEMREKWKHNIAFMEAMEQDGAPLFQEMFGPLLDQPNLPPEMRAFINQAGAPTHQLDFLLQILGFLGSMVSVLPQLGAISVRQAAYDLNESTRNVPLSPADAADGVMRGVIENEAGDAAAAKAGVTPGDFQTMVNLIGEPPPLEEMVALYRRGDMAWTDLAQMVAYSRVNVRYTPWYLEIGKNYMSPADAIELAIKGVVDPGTAEEMFMKGGGYDGQFTPLYEAAGDAIGNEQVLGLLNQGLATESDVFEVFGRSRMNPIFYNLALELRHKFLQPFQIAELLKANPALANQATEWMLALGYNAEQVSAFVATNAVTTMAKAKEESESMVVALFIEQVLTEAEAVASLESLGYDPAGADLILANASAKQALSQRNNAVGSIRSAYVANRITGVQASMMLDQLEIPPAARDQWLAAWNVEQETKVKELTAAQVGDLMKKEVITQDQAILRWLNMGYSVNDANLLSLNYGAPGNSTVYVPTAE